MSCGGNFAMFITDSDEVLSCGANACGQLGLGHANDTESPTPIEELRGVGLSEARSTLHNPATELCAVPGQLRVQLLVGAERVHLGSVGVRRRSLGAVRSWQRWRLSFSTATAASHGQVNGVRCHG